MFEDQLAELDSQRDALLVEARSLTEAGLEGDTLTRFETIEGDIADIAKRRDGLERAARGLADGTLTRTPGDQSDGERGPQHLRRVDPWAERNYSDSLDNIKDRGLAAIDRVRDVAPEDRARVAELIRSDRDDETADYIAAASNPAYERAFAKIVSGPLGRLDWTPEERAAFDAVESTKVRQELRQESRASLSTTGGSALLPVFIDPQINLTSAGARGDFRSFSRVETISAHAWNGATSAGITAAWNSEGAETTDATPTISSAQITPVRGDMYVEATYEMVQDGPAFVQQLGMLFQDGKYKLEQAAFATGAGGTASPEGIVTRLLATTTSRVAVTTNGSFGYPDIFAMPNNLPARWQDNASWAAHWSVFNLVRTMNPTNAGTTFWTDMGPSIPPQLLGAPAHQVSGMFNAPLSTSTASSDAILVLGDFSQYMIVDRLGTEVHSSDWVIGSNRRPVATMGYFAIFRTGAGTLVPDAFRLLIA